MDRPAVRAQPREPEAAVYPYPRPPRVSFATARERARSRTARENRRQFACGGHLPAAAGSVVITARRATLARSGRALT
ncbi:predicted protein [Streptomyces sp. SPB78]|nr:predicted protein [Streptomyces sp. SPB78]